MVHAEGWHGAGLALDGSGCASHMPQAVGNYAFLPVARAPPRHDPSGCALPLSEPDKRDAGGSRNASISAANAVGSRSRPPPSAPAKALRLAGAPVAGRLSLISRSRDLQQLRYPRQYHPGYTRAPPVTHLFRTRPLLSSDWPGPAQPLASDPSLARPCSADTMGDPSLFLLRP